MTDETDNLTPQEKLRAAVERQKTLRQGKGAIPGKRSAEAAASHRSFSKSKPAMRK